MLIGWPVNVNKFILDSTNVTVGNGAVLEDNLESGGLKKRRLLQSNPPDEYKVTMAFDFVQKDINGLTEADRFWIWYKFKHCYGVNPFAFPAILLNSNRQQGYSTEDVSYGNVPDTEYYVITSPAEGSKSGNSVQVSMSWKTHSTGLISIPDDVLTIDHIIAENGFIDVVLTDTPSTEPTATTWAIYISRNNHEEQVAIKSCYFINENTARLFFDEMTDSGVYTARVNNITDTFTV